MRKSQKRSGSPKSSDIEIRPLALPNTGRGLVFEIGITLATG
jgi:hypothetical protein